MSLCIACPNKPRPRILWILSKANFAGAGRLVGIIALLFSPFKFSFHESTLFERALRGVMIRTLNQSSIEFCDSQLLREGREFESFNLTMH
jgi:hypothetical protein